MPEVILNSSNIDELSESMNFEMELFKSKPRLKEERRLHNNNKLGGLFRRFFHLKTMQTKNPLKSAFNATSKKKKILLEAERLKNWNEITRKEAKEFHKMDRLAKFKLSKIIPSEISKKRFQELIVPKDSAPNSLKRIFQYLSYTVKSDLISECISTEPTNYRPLTFCPDFIYKDHENKKKYSVDAEDWIVANLMIFQNLANLLYGISSADFCKPSCCPIMTIGKDYEYMWCDGITFINPISVPARTYMKFCLLWTQKQLHEMSSDSTAFKMIYKRLLRVYAHLYTNHRADFDKIGVCGLVLQCMIRRFILFGLENGLTGTKELEPIKALLKQVKREFRLNEPKE